MKLQGFLPLITYPDANSVTIASAAVSIARQLDAELHALTLEADIPAVSNALSNLLMKLPDMIQEAEQLSARRAAELLAAVRAAAAPESVLVTTNTVTGHLPILPELAAKHARYHDISLIGWSDDNPATRVLAEAVVFGSGRPALLIPETLSAIRLDHVAIAWDAGRAASRALADARPLLERASAVLVITDEKPLSAEAGKTLADGLTGAAANLPARRSRNCRGASDGRYRHWRRCSHHGRVRPLALARFRPGRRHGRCVGQSEDAGAAVALISVGVRRWPPSTGPTSEQFRKCRDESDSERNHARNHYGGSRCEGQGRHPVERPVNDPRHFPYS